MAEFCLAIQVVYLAFFALLAVAVLCRYLEPKKTDDLMLYRPDFFQHTFPAKPLPGSVFIDKTGHAWVFTEEASWCRLDLTIHLASLPHLGSAKFSGPLVQS